MASRREFLRISTLAAGGVVLAACAPSTSAPEPAIAAPTSAPAEVEPAGAPTTAAPANAEPTKATKPTAKPAPREKAVIRWISPLTADVEQTYTHYWRDVYNEQNENVEVIVEDVGWTNRDTKIRAYIAAGDPPQMSTAVNREMYKMGWVDPLDDCMADLKDGFRDIVFAADSECIYEEGDKILWLGAPLLVSGWGIMARPDWIKEKGLGDVREEPPQTWDDLLALMKALHDAPSIYAYNDRLASGTENGALAPWAFQSNGLENLADFREEQKDAYIEVLDFMQQMWSYCSPDAVNWQDRDLKRAFQEEFTAFIVQGSWFYGDMVPVVPELAVREHVAVLPPPSGPHGVGRPQVKLSPMGHWIFKDCMFQEETCEFLRFMAGDDQCNSFPMNMSPKKDVDIDKQITALKDLYPQWFGDQSRWWYEDWYKLIEEYPAGYQARAYMPSNEINKIFGDECVKLFSRQITPEKAYDELAAKIVPIKIDA